MARERRSVGGTGLVTWLEELLIAAVKTRGLSASLAAGAGVRQQDTDTCHAVMREATVTLMARAVGAATIRPDVTR